MQQQIDSSINEIAVLLMIYRILSIPKIKWAIDTFKQFKSFGSYGIITAMLQHTLTVIVPIGVE